jgi:L-fuconolactonase
LAQIECLLLRTGEVANSAASVIDAHVHFWDPSRLHYAWLDATPALRRRFTPEDLDPGRHAVTGFVFVQADCRDEEATAEVEWVSDLARHHPILGIVAHAPLEQGIAVRPTLERLAAHPRVVGVRRLLQGEPEALLRSPGLLAGVRSLAEFGLAFDACVTHEQLPALVALARACPGVTIVLDHLGKPAVAERRLDPWRSDLSALAACPDVVCKLSGLTTEADHAAWQPQDLRPYLDHALAAFGPDRCLVGSDWPVATLATSYERWFDLLDDALCGLDAVERAAVLAGTARRVYRLAGG